MNVLVFGDCGDVLMKKARLMRPLADWSDDPRVPLQLGRIAAGGVLGTNFQGWFGCALLLRVAAMPAFAGLMLFGCLTSMSSLASAQQNGGQAVQSVSVSGEQPYLLAASPAQGFPITLYRIGERTKLAAFRHFNSLDGDVTVTTSDDAIFMTDPSAKPTRVVVLHKNDPARDDEVDGVNSANLVSELSLMMTAHLPAGVEQFLMPLIEMQTGGGPSLQPLVRVAAEPSPTGTPRVEKGGWEAYANLCFEGVPGGPQLNWLPEARVVGRQIVLSRFGRIEQHPVPLASVPPGLDGSSPLAILTSSSDYFVVCPQELVQKGQAERPVDPLVLYVLLRATGQWKVIRPEVSFGVRLFGPWLGGTEVTPNPTHKPSPGREGERSTGTDELPDVRGSFDFLDGLYYHPGRLVLTDPQQGTTLHIETHAEDSEVLAVRNGMVYYRIDDAIYRAALGGGRVGTPELMVKDVDVPEVHWIFWAK